MEATIKYIQNWMLIVLFAITGSAVHQPALVSYDNWTKSRRLINVVSTHKGFKFWWKNGKMRIKFK